MDEDARSNRTAVEAYALLRIRRVFDGGYIDMPLRQAPGSWVIAARRYIPTEFHVHLHPIGGRPEIDVRVEVDPRTGAGHMVDLHAKAPIGSPRLDYLDREVLRKEDVALFVLLASDPIVPLGASDEPAQREAAVIRRSLTRLNDRRVAIRRTIDHDLMTRVAAAYGDQPGGLNRIERLFGVSKNTAARWVRTARERGYIPEKGEG